MTRRKWIAGGIAVGLAHAAGRPYKKGICSVAFARGTGLDEMFRLAKEASFDSIELRLDVDLTEPGDIKRRAADHGLEIASLWASQPLSKYPLNSPDAATRAKGVDSIIRASDVAAGIGCGAVLLVPGRVGNGAKLFDGYEDTWKRFTEELQKCVSAGEKNRVLLTVENVWNKFLLSPLEMRTFVDQFRSPWVAAHFDMGNVMPWGYPEDWIHTLGSRIRRIHVKDYKLPTGAEGGRFVPLWEGDVNYAAVMAALRDVKYEGFLSAEIEYTGPDTVRKVSAQMDRILSL
ncbi:MAG TPA: sugar phosphate isomerase/epimerase family protein [Bryobacteraceae bacterium]|nr:sugar phosphate isomerase/epimerase family protein [Bryobacteraceae bacterium]